MFQPHGVRWMPGVSRSEGWCFSWRCHRNGGFIQNKKRDFSDKNGGIGWMIGNIWVIYYIYIFNLNDFDECNHQTSRFKEQIMVLGVSEQGVYAILPKWLFKFPRGKMVIKHRTEWGSIMFHIFRQHHILENVRGFPLPHFKQRLPSTNQTWQWKILEIPHLFGIQNGRIIQKWWIWLPEVTWDVELLGIGFRGLQESQDI